VKRQRVGGKIERLRHGAGRHSVRTRLHQQAVNVEPVGLSERGQSRYRICFSIFQRISKYRRRVKRYFGGR
jgi:hypothetical protein